MKVKYLIPNKVGTVAVPALSVIKNRERNGDVTVISAAYAVKSVTYAMAC